MTRKDFDLIAKTLHGDRPWAVGKLYDTLTPWDKGTYDQWHTTVLAMAEALASVNDRFNKNQFIEACKKGVK